jgi:hypothetical protein
MIGRFGLTDPARRLFLLPTISTRTGGVLMRPVDRGIHTHIPGDQPGRIGTDLQRGQDQRPHSGPLPAPEQPVHGLPAAVSRRHVAPGRPDPDPPADPVDQLSLGPLRWTARLLPDGQQRLKDHPLRVGQVGPARRRYAGHEVSGVLDRLGR